MLLDFKVSIYNH